MIRLSRFWQSKITHILTGLLMAALWGWFSYRHIVAYQNSRELAYLLICVSEMITAVFFLLRSSPSTVSSDPLDWFFAIGGTFAPFLFIPSEWGIFPPAKHLIFFGTALQIFGLISLNRSLAVVAAQREIKTKGMYQFVRHPLYASYLIIFTGYILSNTTLLNFFLYLIATGFLLVRMVREESHLMLNPVYKKYMQDVQYRVIPFVF